MSPPLRSYLRQYFTAVDSVD